MSAAGEYLIEVTFATQYHDGEDLVNDTGVFAIQDVYSEVSLSDRVLNSGGWIWAEDEASKRVFLNLAQIVSIEPIR